MQGTQTWVGKTYPVSQKEMDWHWVYLLSQTASHMPTYCCGISLIIRPIVIDYSRDEQDNTQSWAPTQHLETIQNYENANRETPLLGRFCLNILIGLAFEQDTHTFWKSPLPCLRPVGRKTQENNKQIAMHRADLRPGAGECENESNVTCGICNIRQQHSLKQRLNGSWTAQTLTVSSSESHIQISFRLLMLHTCRKVNIYKSCTSRLVNQHRTFFCRNTWPDTGVSKTELIPSDFLFLSLASASGKIISLLSYPYSIFRDSGNATHQPLWASLNQVTWSTQQC